MDRLNALKKLLDSEINKFALALTDSTEINAVTKYILGLGGKRIRPLLVLLANDLFEGKNEDAIPSAIAVELFHNFTLIHDDIMDNAPLRRGNATVHEKWNTNTAILSGDAMMIKAYELLSKTNSGRLNEIMNLFSKTALEVCEGQEMDMAFEKKANVSINEYIRMIELKTAVLLAGSLSIGALTANAKPTEVEALYAFGRNMGIAFQLQDDILDVYADQAKFGKQAGGDIIANKKTFLLIKCLEESKKDISKHAELNMWLNKEPFNTSEKVKAVTEIYNVFNIRSIAEKEMQGYFNLALDHLNKVTCSPIKKQQLIALAENLLDRES